MFYFQVLQVLEFETFCAFVSSFDDVKIGHSTKIFFSKILKSHGKKNRKQKALKLKSRKSI